MAKGCENPLATSTPRSEANGSVFRQRKQERVQRFLAGTSRSSYCLDLVLEQSLSTSASDLSQEIETDANCDNDDEGEGERARKRAERKESCKRGCPVILERLTKTYQSVGVHTGKTAQYRKNSYPDPKKGKPPRNITGKWYFHRMIPGCFITKTLHTTVAQNEWIRDSLLDGHGSYLYCHDCIVR